MQRTKIGLLSQIAIVSLAALALAGCGAPSQNTAPSTPDDKSTIDETVVDEANTGSPAGAGEAEFSYGDLTYTAELQFCALQGGEDALFHGVAYDESGAAVGYIGGDFGGLTDVPHGEVRIDFGATGKFQSSDSFVAMGDAMSHMVISHYSDTSLIVVGGAWDQAGTKLPTATLRVSC